MTFDSPGICSTCGYPLVNHPRLDCAYVDGATSHEQHTVPVPGCDRCEDALAEARETLDEWHVGT